METEELREVKVRPLRCGDFIGLSSMLIKLVKNEDCKHIAEMVVDKGAEMQDTETIKEQADILLPLGKEIFGLLQEHLFEPLSNFVVSVIGAKDLEDMYQNYPFDTIPTAINQILARPEFKSFLSGASLLVKPIVKYAKAYAEKRGLSDTTLNSQEENLQN